MKPKIHQIVRWAARILAAVMAAFIAFMFVGNAVTDGVEPLLELTIRETLLMAAFAAVFVGLIVGWSCEKLGGWLVVGGMALFYIFNFIFSGDFPRGPFFVLIALPGLLFLAAGFTKIEKA